VASPEAGGGGERPVRSEAGRRGDGFPGRKNERLILFFLSRLFEADPHSLIIHALQLLFGQCVTPFCRSRGMHRVGGGIFACISFWDMVLFDCYWFHNFIYWSVANP
jgi:hypothetical protein